MDVHKSQKCLLPQMIGRDPLEPNRVASSLELLFDLTFATSFGFAASHFASALTEGHWSAGFLGFGIVTYGICLAWINFSWFASAYDTDDWVYRISTMIQMLGVLILATSIPRLFQSIEYGDRINSSLMVLGYIVMRIAMVFQWLRAAKDNPKQRSSCLTYAISIGVAQLGWVLWTVLDFSAANKLMLFMLLVSIEFLGPYLAERKFSGTPWHTHHIVERNSLFAIIALGECVVGSVATLSAVIEKLGWTLDLALVGLASVGLIFTIWWIYFLIPSAKGLHANRNKSILWGYLQLLLVVSIVATGAGLHIVANFIEGSAHIGAIATLLCVAIPVGVFIATTQILTYYLTRKRNSTLLTLVVSNLCIFAVAIGCASYGVGIPLCLVLLVLAPVLTVIGWELSVRFFGQEKVELNAREARCRLTRISARF